MTNRDYYFLNAFLTKCKPTNQFPMDTLNVLLELIMIRDQIITIDFLAGDVYMINSICAS